MDQFDLDTCTRFFMWGSVLNAGLMTATTVGWMFFRSRVHAMGEQ